MRRHLIPILPLLYTLACGGNAIRESGYAASPNAEFAPIPRIDTCWSWA